MAAETETRTGFETARIVPDFDLDRIVRLGLLIGLAAMIVCFIPLIFIKGDSFFREFFHAYLMAWLFWFGLSLGSLALEMLFHLTGGRWGQVIQPILNTAARGLPLLAVLFVPLLFGLSYNYPWARVDAVAHDLVLRHQHDHYLNIPFFIFRYICYFVIWIGLLMLLNLFLRPKYGRDPITMRRADTWLKAVSGPGLMIYGGTIFFASIDWSMSVAPRWTSSIYSLLDMSAQGLTAISFATLAMVILSHKHPINAGHGYSIGPSKPAKGALSSRDFNDLGNLMLTFVILWAYMSFSQFLIIWAGNLPEEMRYYTPRVTTAWKWVGLALILFHFFLPFFMLLSRSAKRNPRVLGSLAVALLIMRVVDYYWFIEPSTIHTRNLHFEWIWMDVLLPVGLGGIWVAFFAWQLKGRAVIPIGPPDDEVHTKV